MNVWCDWIFVFLVYHCHYHNLLIKMTPVISSCSPVELLSIMALCTADQLWNKWQMYESIARRWTISSSIINYIWWCYMCQMHTFIHHFSWAFYFIALYIYSVFPISVIAPICPEAANPQSLFHLQKLYAFVYIALFASVSVHLYSPPSLRGI